MFQYTVVGRSLHYLTCLHCLPCLEGMNHKHIMKERSYRELNIFNCVFLSQVFLYCRWHSRQLYEVVADVASYPHFIPFCIGSRILNKSRQGESATSPLTMDAELTVGFLSMKESYVSKVTCKPYISVEVCMIVRIAAQVWPYISSEFYRPSHHQPHRCLKLFRQHGGSNPHPLIPLIPAPAIYLRVLCQLLSRKTEALPLSH